MSLSVEEEFKFSVSQINKGTFNLTNDEKLNFYAYYKQATIGKCNKVKPSVLNLVETYKWENWNKLGQMSKNEAMKKYNDLFIDIYKKYNII